MSESYPIRRAQREEFDLDILDELCENGKLICIIKEYRRVSGFGLKDSKDAIEGTALKPTALGNRRFDTNAVKELFLEHLIAKPEPYTKEEFLNLIEQAIDGMDNYYYDDMIEATEKLFENVKKRGGLEQLAKERDRFLRRI